MTDPLLSIEDLHVTLGGNAVLRGVTTQIPRGKISALIGLNGSGKTTLLRALLREVPYTGRVRFFCGHDHSKPHPSHVGYVPQKLRIDANLPLTVQDLLALGLQRWPLFLGILQSTRVKIDQLLRRVFEFDAAGLRSFVQRPVENLSGGELQRVLMGLAMFPEPELLLLDEPAAGVDFGSQEKFYELIARLNQETGVTVILVSHDLSVVSRHAHHVLCLKDGRIQCEGSPQTTTTREMLEHTFGAGAGVYTHHHPHTHPEPTGTGEG